jgi:predicted ATPase
LISDLRGYTRYTLEHGDEAAARLAARFADVATTVVQARDGELVEVRGDEVLAVFSSARQALRAAVELQGRFADEMESVIPAGIGLDAGEAIPVAGGFRGVALNLAARLCSLAGPGEILASDTVANLARRVEGIQYADRGTAQLKGFAEPVRVVAVFPSMRPSPPTPLPQGGRGDLLERFVSPPPSEGEGSGVRGHKLPIGGFLGSLPSSPLVARDDELRRLRAAIDAAAGGEGRTVLLAGEPGAGKTRLAQEATITLRDQGFVIAAGRCYEPEQTVPYYPFLDALAAVFDTAPASIRRDAPRRWPYLAALLPEQIGVQEVAGGGEQDEQQRVFRAVTNFLEAICAAAPIAILLDDLHWADGASLKLLLHLARHTRTLPVLILGTYRDVEVGRQHPLEAALRDLQREGLVERVDVRRLQKEGTSALIGVTMGAERISDEFTELIHGRTEGNPYFVQQVLRVMVERGDIVKKDGVWDRPPVDEIEVPESIRSVVGQRLSRLGATTQEVLHEASILGPTFLFDDLAGMTARPEAEIEAALDEASALGIVRESGRDGYGFDHALTQQSLYGELSARRKRRLHLATAEAIESLPERKRDARVAELAWHFLQADDDRALEWTIRAGDAAEATFAHSDAEGQYLTALELARDGGDDTHEAEVLAKLGEVLRLSGRFDAAIEQLEDAWHVYDRLGDRENALYVVEQLGRVHSRRGTPQEGLERVLPVLQGLLQEGIESVSPRTAAGLYVALAHLNFALANNAELLRTAQEGARLAELAGDRRLLSEAENRHGTALQYLGRQEEGIPVLEKAAELAEAAGDLLTYASALNNVAVSYFALGRFREALPWRERALEVALRLGEPGQIAFQRTGVSFVLFMLGRWTEARALAERAVQEVRAIEPSWYTLYPLTGLGTISLAQGQREEGIAYIEEALALAERNGDLQGLFFLFFRAEQHILDGEPEIAIARLEPLVARIEASIGPEDSGVLAWAYLETGDEAKAAEILARARAQAEQTGNRGKLVEAAGISGILATRLRRWEDAARSFDEALTLARQMEVPYMELRVLYGMGLMDAARGNPEQAREHLEHALTIGRSLGERQYAELCERALAELGGNSE